MLNHGCAMVTSLGFIVVSVVFSVVPGTGVPGSEVPGEPGVQGEPGAPV